jgi:hypothetical protein
VTVVATVTPVSTPTPIPAVSPSPAIPRAGADEDSAYKPPRAVKAVGRAGVGIIRVVTVRTRRRRGCVTTVALVIVSIVIVPIRIIPILLRLRRALIGRSLIRLTLVLRTLIRRTLISLVLPRIGANSGVKRLGLRVSQRQGQRSH